MSTARVAGALGGAVVGGLIAGPLGAIVGGIGAYAIGGLGAGQSGFGVDNFATTDLPTETDFALMEVGSDIVTFLTHEGQHPVAVNMVVTDQHGSPLIVSAAYDSVFQYSTSWKPSDVLPPKGTVFTFPASKISRIYKKGAPIEVASIPVA